MVSNRWIPLTFVVLLGLICHVQAQDAPVQWTFEVHQTDQGTHEFVATATIKSPWVIYSQHTDPDGPVPTRFEFETVLPWLQPELIEFPKAKEGMDPLFELNVAKHESQVTFSRHFSTSEAKSLIGTVTYMTCDGNRCLPPKAIPFDIVI